MVLAREDEAGRWHELSVYAFWLRNPCALEGDPPYRPVGLEAGSDRFRRFGQELQALEWDLVENLNEFETAYRVLYRDPPMLALKKFAIVYHTDNFHVRVHKLLENVYGLLGLLVGVDPAERPDRREPPKRQRVSEALDPRKRKILQEFEGNGLVRHAVEARNRFVHLYREEPKTAKGFEWRWAVLGPESRIREFQGGPDEISEELRRITDASVADDYADAKVKELVRTLEVIQTLRDELYNVFLSDVTDLVLASSIEVQTRLRGLLEWARVWRELILGEHSG